MSGGRLLAAAGVVPGEGLREALGRRANILDMTERSRESVLSPAEPGGLSHALRAALAARVARLTGEEALAVGYDEALARLGPAQTIAALAAPSASPPAGEAGLAAMVAHVDLVAADPRSASQEDIARLKAAGVPEDDIVRLSQLVAFVAYEARVVAGLRLMGAA